MFLLLLLLFLLFLLFLLIPFLFFFISFSFSPLSLILFLQNRRTECIKWVEITFGQAVPLLKPKSERDYVKFVCSRVFSLFYIFHPYPYSFMCLIV